MMATLPYLLKAVTVALQKVLTLMSGRLASAAAAAPSEANSAHLHLEHFAVSRRAAELRPGEASVARDARREYK